MKVLTLFGTRPEVIKVAPVAAEFARRGHETLNVASGQHAEMAPRFAETLGMPIHRDLAAGRPGQTPLDVLERVTAAFAPLVRAERPDLILVQGDTTTTLAGALVGFHERVAVGHIEAGLRSGNRTSPFPEEMNRRLVTQLAELHFAATERNRQTLLDEGVDAERVELTGNPVVDAVNHVLATGTPSPAIAAHIDAAAHDGHRLILLTTHRRESFGDVMRDRLRVMRRFVEARPDVQVVFPVHPNPAVRSAAHELLGDVHRMHLLDPVDYADCIHLLKAAWLVVSDSGGIQEEAPSVGCPLIVIRDNTERPEAIDSGVACLAPDGPALERLLEEAEPGSGGWTAAARAGRNPFGDGQASARIAAFAEARLDRRQSVAGAAAS